MSDPTIPVPDPVEDLVRRAFAVRAEDMAPGDGALEPPLPQVGRAGRGPARPPGRAVLAAALVIVVAAMAATVAIVTAGDGDRDTSGRVADGLTGSLANVSAASERLTSAVQDERNLAAITLIGQDDLIDVPVSDAAQARLATDTAVDEFTASVDASPEAALYQPAVDALGGLVDVRSQVDGNTGPRTLQNIESAEAVFDGYSGILDGLRDGQRAAIATIEDPDVRLGASVHLRGQELADRTLALARAALMSSVRPGPEVTAELSALHTEVQQGLDALAEETAGTPYEEAASTVITEIEESGLLETTGAALEGATDLAAILDAAELPEGQGWRAYLDRVGAILAEQG